MPLDLKIMYATDPTTGRLTVDLAQAPTGGLATMTGIDLLVQMVTRWMLLRVGANAFHPTHGNPAIDLAGQDTPANPIDEITGLVQIAEATFLQAQQRAVALGQLAPSETAQAFGAPDVRKGVRPGQFILSFVVTNRAGQPGRVSIPVSV